ncbi:putative homogentisate phytyltransferase 1 [Citrus sinensis]|uniref:Homogentisate phytyltransferase 1 n=1 Tax=Citrus sinensis TaxID=2711 RepID=A0ACB8JEV5_CITSI|nr:putative homogentisate phytyltransferase 1 [Citrus sinensis]
MMERNHKPLKKSTVPMALQDGYPSKSQDENIVSTSFVDVLTKKLDAFYRLCRPYAWTSIILGIVSTSLLPVETLADLTPTFLIEVLKAIVATLTMNIFVRAINQLSDIEIDKVNKPNLPLASGDFSIGEGIAIAIISTLTSLAMGVMLRSPPLVIALVIRWIVGAAYSIDLPLLRWKASPLMAVVAIIILNGINVLPYFVHFQVFSISISMLLLAYGGAALAGVSSPFLLCKLVTMIGHSVLGFILWCKAQAVDLSNTKSTYSFFIFIFQASTFI